MSTHAQDWSKYPAPLPPIAPARAQPADGERHRRHYLSVRLKFALTVTLALTWSVVSYLLARRWLHDLSGMEGNLLAMLMIFGIAILPGFMNAFLVAGLLLDRRPARRYVPDAELPGLTVLVAAYNEEDSILSTLASIDRQYYGGTLEVIVINDGSTDRTMDLLRTAHYPWLHVIDLKCNGGKANALNVGLRHATQPLAITLDADSYLYRHALRRLVERYLSDPPNTAAVAGAVLVRNSRQNLITRMQEWDYFHGIAAVKRLQSLFQGTLVAQGAFSLYRTDILRRAGGWPECVGEDIVLTWAILRMGHRVGYCEDAVTFTNAPTTFRQFMRQRQRWSRGLIEAFKTHGALLFHRRMSTLFIWWNLLFPYMDLVYTLVFIPGLILACFGIYWLAGPMTLLVLPMAGLVNYIMYFIQSRMFRAQGLKVRHNPLGLLVYTLFYGIVLQPGCVLGYAAELLKMRKRWGTK